VLTSSMCPRRGSLRRSAPVPNRTIVAIRTHCKPMFYSGRCSVELPQEDKVRTVLRH